MMGASNPHPHGQVWAQATLPLHAARETERQAAHHDRHRRTLLGDYLALELAREERVVCANDGFVALVPFWAVWPFETLVVSRRPAPHLGALTDAERDQLADVVQRLTRRYDQLFGVSFPYSAGVHQAPTDGPRASGVASAPALLSPTPPLGDGAQVPRRLRDAR
jgi:UDPglucose--hexose-1-phosphate uridylyltransferase